MRRTKRYYLDPLKMRYEHLRYRLYVIRLFGLPLFLFVPLLATLALFRPAYAVSYTWDGGGADNNWSTCANWTTDTCPVAGDSVTFNNTSNKNAVVDVGFGGSLASLTTSASYSGTITLSRSLTLTSGMTIGTGTFDAGSQTLSTGALTITGGTFTASSTTTSISSTLNISGTPVFNHNNGTVTFDGSSSVSLGCNNVSFNLVTFAHTAGTKTIQSSCSLPLGANPTVGSGASTPAISLFGTLSGSGSLTIAATSATGSSTINSGASLSGFAGLIVNGSMTFANTFNASSYSTFTITRGFTLNSGAAFTAPSGTMSVGLGFTINTGSTFTHNNGTLNFNGTGGTTIACNNTTFNQVTFTHTAGTKTINSDCSLPLGASPTLTGAVALSGTLSGSGTMTTSATYTRNAGSTVTGFTGIIANSTYTINGATVNLGSYTTADFNGAFQLTSGSFTAPSGNMTAASTFTISAGTTFNANGGTVTFDGTATATLSCNNVTFSLVTLAHSSGTKTVSSDCNFPLGANPSFARAVTLNGSLSGSGTLNASTASTFINNTGSSLSGFDAITSGNFQIAGATVNLSGYTSLVTTGGFNLSSGSLTAPPAMNIAGNFTITGGTFNANGGTVTFDGSSGTLSCNNVSFSQVVFAHTSNTKIVNSDCSLPLGNNPSAYAISLSGTLTGSGTFNGTSNLTLNSGASMTGFNGLVVGAAFTINGATVNLGSYTTADFNGAFLLTSGSFTAPSGTMTTASTFTLSSGTTFTANGGTLVFDGGGGVLSCNNTSFNLVVFAHTGSSTKTVGADCNLPLGNNPVVGNSGDADPDLALNGTLTGTGILTIASQASSNSLTLNAGSSLSGFNGLAAGGLNVNGATYNFGSYASFDVNGAFTLQSGTNFTAPAGTMAFAHDFTINSGVTFNANGGIILFDGTNSNPRSVTCNNTIFNQVVFAHTLKTYTINSGCSLPLGSNPTLGAGGSVSLNGTLSGSGTISATGLLTLNSGYSLSGFNGLNVSDLLVDTTTLDLSSYNTADIDNDLVLQNNATLIATPAATTIGGDIEVTPGSTFSANSGNVLLDGSDQTITGDIAWHNLSKTVASDATLTIDATSTQSVSGTLLLKGTSSTARLSIVSSVPGTAWNVSASSADVRYIRLADSNNTGATLTAFDSVNAGGNSGWLFKTTPVSETTTTSTTTTASTSSSKRALANATSDVTEDTPNTSDTPAVVTPAPTKPQPGKATTNPETTNADRPASIIIWSLGGAFVLSLGGTSWWLVLRRRQSHTPPPPTIFTP